MSERTLAYSRAYLDSDSGDGPLVFTASSEVLNRHGFSLRSDGWRLENFAANPVVLWMHNAFQPPIGRAAVSQQNKRVMAEVTFDRDDEFARVVEGKFRRGFLNAVSVGLDFVDEDGAPLSWWGMSTDELRDEAFYDLAELSTVTVPADPTAVRESQRLALSRLGRELVELFGEQEYGTATAPEIRAAVRAEMSRLGLAPLGAVGPHNTAVVEGTWDGSANEKRLPSPMPVATARKVYGWFDDAAVEEGKIPKSAGKLPHHEVSEDGTPGAANLNGVRNALARLPQTEGLSDAERETVERHLRAHLDKGTENSAPMTVDEHAAQAILAAFSLKEGSSVV